MGMHIDLLGRFSVRPTLNRAETEYLRALAVSGPAPTADDPWNVPDHPHLELTLRRSAAEHDVPTPATEPPSGCGWEPCVQGCCLAWSGVEKFARPGDWLAFLVDHLLRPGAVAQRSPSALLEDFTFDHVVDGVVAATCAETTEMWLVVARHNEVSEVLLGRGEGEEGFWPLLPLVHPLDPLDPAAYRTDGVPVRGRTAMDGWLRR